MYIDKQNLFCEDKALTSQGTSYSDVLDMVVAGRGKGEALDVWAQVTTLFASAGAATLQIILQTDTVENFATPTDLLDTGAVSLATLVAGYEFAFGRLPDGAQRYLRLKFVVATADFTAGKLSSALVLDRQSNVY